MIERREKRRRDGKERKGERSEERKKQTCNDFVLTFEGELYFIFASFLQHKRFILELLGGIRAGQVIDDGLAIIILHYDLHFLL